MKTLIRKNDTVVILSGEYKRSKGRVLKVDREKHVALVEGINLVKRHTKPNKENQQGGIIEKEAPIHLSNLMLIDPSTGNPTRAKKEKNGKNIIRKAVGTNEEIK